MDIDKHADEILALFDSKSTYKMTKTLVLIILFSLCNLNCKYTYSLETRNNDMSVNNILPALKERNDLGFDNKTRDLHSIVKDSLKFDYIFPNTDVSCGYVIRYFFHTNIHLGKESNKLISMNGSIFNFENIDINEEREYIISLTKSVLMVVGDMYFGSSELQEFLNIYPDVVI